MSLSLWLKIAVLRCAFYSNYTGGENLYVRSCSFVHKELARLYLSVPFIVFRTNIFFHCVGIKT